MSRSCCWCSVSADVTPRDVIWLIWSLALPMTMPAIIRARSYANLMRVAVVKDEKNENLQSHQLVQMLNAQYAHETIMMKPLIEFRQRMHCSRSQIDSYTLYRCSCCCCCLLLLHISTQNKLNWKTTEKAEFLLIITNLIYFSLSHRTHTHRELCIFICAVCVCN